MSLTCQNCGAAMPEGAQVCPYCGAASSVNQQPQTPPQQQAPAQEQQYQAPPQGAQYQAPPQGAQYQVPPQGAQYQAPPQGTQYQQVPPSYQTPPYPGQQPVRPMPLGYNQKSKMAAGLLGIFLGWIGVHNFYLGYTGKAVAQLILGILSCGAISGIWGLIEGILILTGSIKVDGLGYPLRD